VKSESASLEKTLKRIAEDHWLAGIKDYVPSAWIGHAPFLKYLIREVKPKIFVELGTHYGLSYFVACETINELDLETKCYAVDHWSGDKHAGYYDDSVYESVKNLNFKYRHFSKLLRMTFLEGRSEVNEPIDLLHIDGHHTYEAVKEDFETWLPKMNLNGIIILHDIHVRREDFGVYTFWSEIKQRYRTMEFVGSYGLGVVFLGEIIGEELNLLMKYVGEGLIGQVQGTFENHSDVAVQSYRVRETERLQRVIQEQTEELSEKSSQLDLIFNSSSWAITKPLRTLKQCFKGTLK
jgi:predicted O-methyltransferase YrrM